jgi:arginyl-tRNA synthetase
MDFDISLAKQKSNQNPVYYVQYAHARIESIIEKIKESGPENRDLNGFSVENFSFEKIDTSEMVFKNKCERKLAKTMILYPDVVYSACRSNAPYLVTQYLYRLASEFHYFYNNFRIINDIDGRVTIDTDRFVLIMLVRQVLQNALKLLNVSAPRKM